MVVKTDQLHMVAGRKRNLSHPASFDRGVLGLNA